MTAAKRIQILLNQDAPKPDITEQINWFRKHGVRKPGENPGIVFKAKSHLVEFWKDDEQDIGILKVDGLPIIQIPLKFCHG